MDANDLILFIAASWILIITPGPDMLYVITRGISQGPKAGVISAVGVTLGIFIHTLFAALGLAVILRTSAIAFFMVKYIGALYLVYLGIKTLTDKSSMVLQRSGESAKIKTIFIQGMLSNVFNPKIALFFLAFLPQFVKPENGSVPLQMIFLGLSFASFGIVFLMLLGYFSGNVGTWLSRRHSVANKVRRLTGSILIALGLRLAFIEQK
jgi:threonine/homoserine/homoserine lactone efflux protein